MKKVILLFFLMINFTLTFAQSYDEKRGTIRIRKVKTNKILPTHATIKKPEPRIFIMRSNSLTYKETFPKGYRSELFPLVFNGGGLILADANKQWSSNTIIGYNYEIFVGNATAGKITASSWAMNSIIRGLALNQYLWISGLYYSDSKGNIHFNEIGEFKVERLN
ncbi:MAG: hypothetical protein ACT4ON_03920 [Bacteroidota bacterium]